MRKGSVLHIGSSIFVLALLLGAFLVVVSEGVYADQAGDYTYSVSNGNATITGYTGAGGAIIIPSALNNHTVVAIGDNAFGNNTQLTSVTIPNSVKYIGDVAFEYCTSLTSVTIPNSVTSIGSDVFFDCTSLTSVTIPNNVTSIREATFMRCTSLTSISIGNGVASIGDYAFYDCISLTSMTMPNSVTYIGNYSFCYCFSLAYMAIPKNVIYVGNDAFLNCSSMTNVNIPNSVTYIGDDAFDGCQALTSVTISDNVTTIGNRSFAICTSLVSVSVGSGTNFIGFMAFYDCYSLTSIIFQGLMAPTSIGYGWIDFTAGGILGHAYASSNFPAPGNYFHGLMMGAVIPEKTPHYTYTVFKGNATITGYSGPGGTITIPSILNNYTVVGIGDSVFANLTSLTSVTIPNSVSFIGNDAFKSCTALTSINVDSNNTYYASADGVLYNKNLTNLIQFPGGKEGVFTIPNSVTSIEDYAFADCANLTSITIPNSVTSIGIGTFYNCHSLAFANLGNGVTSIGAGAFYNCMSLTSISIPDSVTYVGNSSFGNCSALTAATIGNKVNSIEYGLFGGCGSLTSIIIPNSVVSIGDYAFDACRSLASVTMGNHVASIGISAFDYCTSLTSVTIPNSVTSIGDWAFFACSSLSSLTISNGISSIGKATFAYCTSLSSITIPGDVTSIGDGAFYNCSSLTSMTFLGLIAPTTVGQEWISYTNVDIEGHANVSSDFPAPGNFFHGLLMGGVMPIPGAPTNLTASVGIAQVILTWNIPVDSGSSAIIYYHVYRSTNGDNTFTLIGSPSSLSYTDSNVVKGYTYRYKVSAVEATGRGANCSAINATIANTDFTLHDSGKSYSILVPAGWTVQDNATLSGLHLDTYILGPSSYRLNANVLTGIIPTAITDTHDYLQKTVQGTISLLPYLGATNLTMTDSPKYIMISNYSAVVFGFDYSLLGINIHQEVAFIVDAWHSLYWDITCTESPDARALFDPTFTTMIDSFVITPVPSIPQLLSAIPGNNNVVITWNSPVDNGSTTIAHYYIYRSSTENGTYTLIASPSGLTYTETGLTNGQTYWYKVSAVNTIGEGAMTSPRSSTPYTVPNAPIGPTFIAGNAQATLTWIANGSGGRAITGYKLYRSDSENGSFVLIASPSQSSYTDTNLTNGQTYWYKVSAVNTAGEGALSAAFSVTVPVPFPIWILVAALIVIGVVLVALFLVMRKRQGKKTIAPPPDSSIQGNAHKPSNEYSGQVLQGNPPQSPPPQSQSNQSPSSKYQDPSHVQQAESSSPTSAEPIKYCPWCGAQTIESPFCGNCGRQLK